MQPNKLMPLITTDKLDDLKAFYVGKLGFLPTFDSPGYLGLRGGAQAELAFMRPDDDAPRAFHGEGLSICLEVADVDREHERLARDGVTIAQPPKDNPWGDRSFVALDPIGIAVYVYHPTEPSPEFAQYCRE